MKIVVLTSLLMLFALSFSRISQSAAITTEQASLPNDNHTVQLLINSHLALINGSLIDINPPAVGVTPVIVNSTSYIPLRYVAALFGFELTWQPSSNQATLFSKNQTADVASPQLIGSTLFAPLLSLCQSIQLQCTYQNGLLTLSNPQTTIIETDTAATIDLLSAGFRYKVFINGELADAYVSKSDAIAAAQTKQLTEVLDLDNSVIWDNLPPYKVYQNESLKLHFDTYAEASASARTLKQSSIVYNNRTIWSAMKALPQSVIISGVQRINQMPELPRGCEVTSLAMMLNFAGVKVNKMTLAAQIKKVPFSYTSATGRLKGNPYDGFVGDMYSFSRSGLGVYHGPIVELAERYLSGQIIDLTGSSFSNVLHAVANGTPVWVIHNSLFTKLPSYYWETWRTSQGPLSITYKEHSVLVVGYDQRYVYIKDPLNRTTRTLRTSFENGWIQMGRQAVTYMALSESMPI